METLGSAIISAVITIVIAAKFRREIMDYVDEVCDLNINQVNKIKEISIKTVKGLVEQINSKNE
nr:hypothetical protein [uncultured Schaedlerella sp.]